MLTTVLSWLRANFWPVALVVVGLFSFRTGKKMQENTNLKEKTDVLQDTIRRQKAMADAAASAPRDPAGVSKRLRDGDA